MIKLCVVIPSGTAVHANFAIALAAMVRDSQGVLLNFLNIKSSNICISRSMAVDQVQKTDAQYMLFIDSDLSFPSDALTRLLGFAESENKLVVGCNYVQRQPPYRSLAYGMPSTEKEAKVDDFVQVRRLPTGMLLLNMKVFEKMKRPYFRFLFQEETDVLPPMITGEDYYFCDVAYDKNIEVWMDTQLSMNLVHWGDRGVQWSGNERGYEFMTDQGLENI